MPICSPLSSRTNYQNHTEVNTNLIKDRQKEHGETIQASHRSMTPFQHTVASPIIHYSTANKPPIPQRPFTTDPNLLSPDAAFYAHPAPPHEQPQQVENYAHELEDTVDGDTPSLRGGGRSRKRAREGRRSRSRRGKGVWRKLLWVKQKECELHTPEMEYRDTDNDDDDFPKTRIITPIPQHSCLISNAIRDYAHTTFGPW